MAEQTNGINNLSANGSPGIVAPRDSSWTIGPREFVIKYLRYLPWVLICAALALVFAYIKIRYTTPIFQVQSSLLIKNSGPNGGGDAKLTELFGTQSGPNLSNEIPILKSSPVIRRVVHDLDFETHYYGQGKIRSTLLYPESPFHLQVIHIAEPSRGFGISITMLNEEHYLINPSKKPSSFGQIVELNGNRFILSRNMDVSTEPYSSNIF